MPLSVGMSTCDEGRGRLADAYATILAEVPAIIWPSQNRAIENASRSLEADPVFSNARLILGLVSFEYHSSLHLYFVIIERRKAKSIEGMARG